MKFEPRMTKEQIYHACDILRAQLTDHAFELPAEAVQKVLERFDVSREWLVSFRRHVEDVGGMIIRKVRVDRGRNPQELLNSSGRVRYIDESVVATMPKGEGEEVEIHLFRQDAPISHSNLEIKLKACVLQPDPRALIQLNIDMPSFANNYPHSAQWKISDDKGGWGSIVFGGYNLEHTVHVYRSHDCDIWHSGQWFGGVFKVLQ